MFRNTRKHTDRDELFSFPGFCFRSWLLFLQYSFQMLSCCQQKKECALTLVFMEYYYSLSNRTSPEGQLRCALDEFPWTTATKIAQVCCALFKIWRSVLRNSPVLFLHPSNTPSFRSQTLLFLLCYFCHQNMLFVSSPISSQQIIFLSEKRICPLSWRS